MATTAANFQRASQKLRAFGDAMRVPTRDALAGLGSEIMADAKDSGPGRGVPVAPERGGKLRDSGRVTVESDRFVRLSFGGGDIDYALKVHEDLDDHHEIGEARYLTRALDRWRARGSAALREYGRATERVIRRIGR